MNDSTMLHRPVMLNEVVGALRPQVGEVYVDGTYGRGGYSSAVLSSVDCKVIGIDTDPDAVMHGVALAARQSCFRIIQGNFSDMVDLLAHENITQVDGIMLDIGVSSVQFDSAERGFSFQKDGPLDMRMSAKGITAADVVNTYTETQLADIIYVYGEERQSRRIARKICEKRAEGPIETTGALAGLMELLVQTSKPQKIHPATRVFQALRIYVNDELGELVRALSAAEHLLKAGGRLVVVSFHSLEDRLVKTFFRERAMVSSSGSRFLPAEDRATPSFVQSTSKMLLPSAEEVSCNPRARSAKLRSGQRTSAPLHGVFAPSYRITNAQLRASWA